MTLPTRLSKLECARPAQPVGALEIDLPTDVEARAEAAMTAGTFPQSLCTDDLCVMRAAYIEAMEDQD